MSRSIRIVFFVACFLIGAFLAINSNNAPQSRSSLSPTPQTTIVAVPTAPPKGWLRFEGGGIAMNLPDSFIGGNIEDLSKAMLTVAKNELPEASALIQNALQNKQISFIAIDQTNAQHFLTNVNAGKLRLSNERYPLQYILDEAIKQFPKYIEIVESGIVSINGIEVIRYVGVMHLQTYSAKTLNYVRIDENNDAWTTAYTTSPDEYDERLPVFEKSYQSFELLPS